MISLLNNNISKIQNNIVINKFLINLKEVSSIFKKCLKKLKEKKYVLNYRKDLINKYGYVLEINKSVTKIQIISPRYNVKYKDLLIYEKRYLLRSDFGDIILSTSEGILTHREAMKKKIGGVLILYVY